MQQIAEWLDKLGMSEYAERFAENKIDASVLRHLTTCAPSHDDLTAGQNARERAEMGMEMVEKLP